MLFTQKLAENLERCSYKRILGSVDSEDVTHNKLFTLIPTEGHKDALKTLVIYYTLINVLLINISVYKSINSIITFNLVSFVVVDE